MTVNNTSEHLDALYLDLRRTGSLIVASDQIKSVSTGLKRRAQAQGLNTSQSRTAPSGLSPSQRRNAPVEIALIRPSHPADIYSPDARKIVAQAESRASIAGIYYGFTLYQYGERPRFEATVRSRSANDSEAEESLAYPLKATDQPAALEEIRKIIDVHVRNVNARSAMPRSGRRSQQ